MVEKIKESLSVQYLSILASHGGFSAHTPFTDYGVDLMVEEISSYQIGDRTRYFSSGRTLDIQLKSTTAESISINEDEIKFDLESKNFNDLIKRHPFQKRPKFRYIPLVLVVFVLPSEADQWLDFSPEKLSIQGKAFWYYPDSEESLTLNRYSKRISIPIGQQVDLDFFQNFFKLLSQ